MDGCRYLAWDSDFFGKRIASLDGETLTRQRLRVVEAWCEAEAIDCLYFLANPDDRETTRLAGPGGFRLVDIRVDLERETGGAPSLPETVRVRPVAPADLDELAPVARKSHTATRFFFDPGFPDERCEDLYEAWLRNSHAGFADAVLVAEAGGRPAGYVTCDRGDGDRPGRIGLLGVSEAARGQGVGQALLAGALGWFGDAGATRVRVATQARNNAALRLYGRAGFLPVSFRLWYHRWRAETERGAQR